MFHPRPERVSSLRSTTGSLILLALAAALTLACSRSQLVEQAPKVSPAPVAKVEPSPPASAPSASSPLVADLKAARRDAICDLAGKVQLPRDAALLAPALDRAFALRREERSRECTFTLLRALQANDKLAALASSTSERERWMAIVFHANRNLRARHFDVYELALKSPFDRVHHAVAGGLGAYGPEAEAIALLARSLDHNNENVRLKSARSLIEIGTPEARELLRKRSAVEKDKAVIVTIYGALNKP